MKLITAINAIKKLIILQPLSVANCTVCLHCSYLHQLLLFPVSQVDIDNRNTFVYV